MDPRLAKQAEIDAMIKFRHNVINYYGPAAGMMVAVGGYSYLAILQVKYKMFSNTVNQIKMIACSAVGGIGSWYLVDFIEKTMINRIQQLKREKQQIWRKQLGIE